MIREFGKNYTKELQMKVMGAPDYAGAKTVVEELELPTSSENFLMEFRRRSVSLISNCGLLPGIWEAILLIGLLLKHALH